MIHELGGDENGARLDFGGGIGIRSADLCRSGSGFEEGVGDWDGNIRGEMQCTPGASDEEGE